MTVEELFRKLSYGELSNHSVSVEGTGTIKKDKRNQILHFVNQGLLELHKKYPLLESSEIVQIPMGGLEITLAPDVLGVLSIMTAWGEPLDIGTEPVPGTIYVFQRKLYIPHPVGSELQVVYYHRHPELTSINQESDLEQEINLPHEFHEALTAWVAYKVYGNMLTAESQTASIAHKQRFDQVCLDAWTGEVIPDSKFEKRGWT